jgi:2-keto-4-pentenoate hydratase/2-oxohepta-3-ene-1,7-dioic acid hydratase in catechol pathway
VDELKIASLKKDGAEEAAIATESGWVSIETVNKLAGRSWSVGLFDLLQRGEFGELTEWSRTEGSGLLKNAPAVPYDRAAYAPLYRHPRKIWGIGANYREKAEHMAVIPLDSEPICFMKPDTSLIGPNENILLPAHCGRVTSEAEIGVVIGKTCKNVTESEAMGFIAGFTPTLDMTAAEIHARNPRFLGRSKCFDTFFSFGPELMTPDECPPLEQWTVETVLNGKTTHVSAVDRMIYSIPFIVAYFSSMMTLLPGDVIMTGTPGSDPLRDGDLAECRIKGLLPLSNPVKQET